MSRLPLLLALGLSLGALRCDGTLTGIGREPRPPEAKLPAAPAETVAARNPSKSSDGDFPRKRRLSPSTCS